MLKEREKSSLQNNAKIMKIDKKKGSYDILKFHVFFRKHFLTSPYEYSNERVDDVIPSQFLLISYTDMTKISYFRYENIKLAL